MACSHKIGDEQFRLYEAEIRQRINPTDEEIERTWTHMVAVTEKDNRFPTLGSVCAIFRMARQRMILENRQSTIQKMSDWTREEPLDEDIRRNFVEGAMSVGCSFERATQMSHRISKRTLVASVTSETTMERGGLRLVEKAPVADYDDSMPADEDL